MPCAESTSQSEPTHGRWVDVEPGLVAEPTQSEDSAPEFLEGESDGELFQLRG